MQPLEVGLESCGRDYPSQVPGRSLEEESALQVSMSSWVHGFLAHVEGVARGGSE